MLFYITTLVMVSYYHYEKVSPESTCALLHVLRSHCGCTEDVQEIFKKHCILEE